MFEQLLTGLAAEKMAEAEQRRAAIIAEVGEEQYMLDYQRKYNQKLNNEYRQSFITSTDTMLGARFCDASFDSFNKNTNNMAAYTACRQYVRGWTRSKQGIFLVGPNGIGKNHLAAAIAKDLAVKMKTVYFGSITKIKTKICDAFGKGVEEAVSDLLKYDLLCINDLGAEQKTEFMKALVFDIVDRLYEDKRGIIITTNLNSTEIKDRYGVRVLSRISEMCKIVKYRDRDHRVKKELTS